MTEHYYIKDFIICYLHNSIKEEYTYYHLKRLIFEDINESLDNLSEMLANKLRLI